MYLKILLNTRAQQSLLKTQKATWNGDEESVAKGVAKADVEACSILQYSNEGSFRSVIHLAYCYAQSYYTIINELPSGKGFADLAFIPYIADVPAIIIELKKDDIVDTAMDRIKEKNILKYWRSTKITSYLLPLATTLRQRNILVEYNKLNKTRLHRFC